jgi:hypothetical protein
MEPMEQPQSKHRYDPAWVVGPVAEQPATPVTPPKALLWLGLGTWSVAAALLVPGSLGAHVAGYVVSGVFSIGVVSAFKRRDVQLQASPYYSPVRALHRCNSVLALGAVLVAVTHAWYIATRLAS